MAVDAVNVFALVYEELTNTQPLASAFPGGVDYAVSPPKTAGQARRYFETLMTQPPKTAVGGVNPAFGQLITSTIAIVPGSDGGPRLDALELNDRFVNDTRCPMGLGAAHVDYYPFNECVIVDVVAHEVDGRSRLVFLVAGSKQGGTAEVALKGTKLKDIRVTSYEEVDFFAADRSFRRFLSVEEADEAPEDRKTLFVDLASHSVDASGAQGRPVSMLGFGTVSALGPPLVVTSLADLYAVGATDNNSLIRALPHVVGGRTRVTLVKRAIPGGTASTLDTVF